MAAIGEQFADCTAEGKCCLILTKYLFNLLDDDVVGVSVKGQHQETQFQIWNENAASVRSATVRRQLSAMSDCIEFLL